MPDGILAHLRTEEWTDGEALAEHTTIAYTDLCTQAATHVTAGRVEQRQGLRGGRQWKLVGEAA